MSKSLRRRDIKLGRLRRKRHPFTFSGTVTGRFSCKSPNYEFIKPLPPVVPFELTELHERILKEMCELTALPLGYRSRPGVAELARILTPDMWIKKPVALEGERVSEPPAKSQRSHGDEVKPTESD